MPACRQAGARDVPPALRAVGPEGAPHENTSKFLDLPGTRPVKCRALSRLSNTQRKKRDPAIGGAAHPAYFIAGGGGRSRCRLPAGRQAGTIFELF